MTDVWFSHLAVIPVQLDVMGDLLLHYACAGGAIELVQTLIYDLNVSARDSQNNIPISIAAFAGNTEVVLSLISEFGCDPNVKGCNGRSLLHDACTGGDICLVQTLINEYKADVNAQDDDCSTPLHVAAHTGKIKIALSLINEFGCDPGVEGYNGCIMLVLVVILS